jgi:hypothetical protein
VTLRAAAIATAASAALPPFCNILIPTSLARGWEKRKRKKEKKKRKEKRKEKKSKKIIK